MNKTHTQLIKRCCKCLGELNSTPVVFDDNYWCNDHFPNNYFNPKYEHLVNGELEFTLCAGVWEHYWKNEKTKEELTPRLNTFLMDKTKIEIMIPNKFKDNKDIACIVKRIR